MPNDSAALAPAAPPKLSATKQNAMIWEALAGLSQSRKTLPAKLFYDIEGCRLFREITQLPEYYLTRTELSLLRTVAPLVAERMPAGSALVEYGASDEAKAEYLLRQYGPEDAPAFRTYIPIDIAPGALRQLERRMAKSHPELDVRPIVADFQNRVKLPGDATQARLGFFPGSTIGNLEPNAVHQFLVQARETLGQNALFLIGFDLRKDPALLIAAYDDAAGVTAAFNRNILAHLNRIAEADFDPERFGHRAVWNAEESRVEMHLVSDCDQIAHVNGQPIRFAAGETIHTENSYKLSPDEFAAMAVKAGWQVREHWTDAASLFALHLLSPSA